MGWEAIGTSSGTPFGIERIVPALYAVFLWWFSTGTILYLDGLPARTFRRSLLGATGVLVVALGGIAWSRSGASVADAYVAFTCAVLVWGWNEIAFLMGFVTGPRQHACPGSCRGWRHVLHAVATILYHELALLASLGVVLALTWTGASALAPATFAVLLAMRVSTKLNLFLGVPNLNAELVPDHLEHLKRYFTRRPMNLLFPVSITAATLLTAFFVQRALAAGTAADATAATFLAALSALGLVEHWFLVLPIPASSLWSWGMRSHARREPPADALLSHGREP